MSQSFFAVAIIAIIISTSSRGGVTERFFKTLVLRLIPLHFTLTTHQILIGSLRVF